MRPATLKYPFEATFDEIIADPDPYVSLIFDSLESTFLFMPKGAGFIEYPVFEQGYETLKKATKNFSTISAEEICKVILKTPISFIVIRAILGFTPPELAYITSQEADVLIPQGFARTLDRKIRFNPLTELKIRGVSFNRLKAMIETACKLIEGGAPTPHDSIIHRLEKADTCKGLRGIQALAKMGAPYAMLLYERFLGRPFAVHRDSVSELVGDVLELAIEDILVNTGISYRKTKRAETIPGFDQAPDFIIPSEFNPKVVIEAKIAEDDGTARDKSTRIQHLGDLSIAGQPLGQTKFEVIACLAGRGFKIRKEDMKKILIATRGKVFTLKTLDQLVEYSKLKEFRSK